jgi:hypothetical protein
MNTFLIFRGMLRFPGLWTSNCFACVNPGCKQNNNRINQTFKYLVFSLMALSFAESKKISVGAQKPLILLKA